MKKLFITLVFTLLPFALLADERVTHVYQKQDVPDETIAVSSHGRLLEDVEYLLIEVGRSELDMGEYEVEVTREDDHIYHIDGTDLYINMPYCYKYAYRDRAILRITSGYSTLSGTLLWIED